MKAPTIGPKHRFAPATSNPGYQTRPTSGGNFYEVIERRGMATRSITVSRDLELATQVFIAMSGVFGSTKNKFIVPKRSELKRLEISAAERGYKVAQIGEGLYEIKKTRADGWPMQIRCQTKPIAIQVAYSMAITYGQLMTL